MLARHLHNDRFANYQQYPLKSVVTDLLYTYCTFTFTEISNKIIFAIGNCHLITYLTSFL